MIRIICKQTNTCPEGTIVSVQYKTFDIKYEQLEAHLDSSGPYSCISCIGAEVIPEEE